MGSESRYGYTWNTKIARHYAANWRSEKNISPNQKIYLETAGSDKVRITTSSIR